MSGFFDTPSPPGASAGAGDAAGEAKAAPYRVLARKWRPTRFADLIGQDAMVRTLRNAFALGRVAHAFMLSGVRGVGKTSTARILARALNCVGPDGTGGPTAEPCGVCPNCRAILAERHPDVVEMDAASRTGVDDVREIIEAVRFRPLEAREKVFIIDEVHMLSRNAFNALLKTLEEPPAHVTFVFATTEVRKVPLTVLSRCQHFALRRLGVAELAAHFARIAAAEEVSITKDALSLIARAADGSVRDGLSLLDQAISLNAGEGPIDAERVTTMLGTADRGTTLDLLEAALAGEPATALKIADEAHARGTDPGLLLGDLLDLVHTLSRLKSVPVLAESAELPELERTRGAALAKRLSIPVLGRAWQMLLKGIGEVETAPDPRAAADMVLIRLCYVAELPPPAELIEMLTKGPARESPRDARERPHDRSSSAPHLEPHPGGPGSGGLRQGSRAARGERLARVDAALPRAEGAARAIVPEAPTAAAEAASPAGALPADFPAAIALVEDAQEPVLAAECRHHAHLVRYAPPVIELRPEPSAPRDLAQRLARTLRLATGVRWTIALSAAEGTPTLAESEAAAAAARRAEAKRHPLVTAILAAFPGAEVGEVRPIGAIEQTGHAETTSAVDNAGETDETVEGDASDEDQPED